MANYYKKSNPPASRVQRLLRLGMVLCLVGLLYSAASLAAGSREYAQGDAAYDRLRQHRGGGTVGGGQDPQGTPQVDFAALGRVNPEVVAWLTGEDGVIDYPVVRGRDNDYYLTHLFDGTVNKLGSLFVDCQAAGDFSGRNTPIYGHNMRDGSMFATLTQYQRQETYDLRPTMELVTPRGTYTVQLFAGLLAPGQQEYIRLSFADDRDFLEYVRELRDASTFHSTVEVGPGDRIVTLSTCSYDFQDARYALFGKLTPQ